MDRGVGMGREVGMEWATTQRLATRTLERMGRRGSRVETGTYSCPSQNYQTPVLIGQALGMRWMVVSGSAGKRGDAVFSSPVPLEISFSSWFSSALFSEVGWGGMEQKMMVLQEVTVPPCSCLSPKVSTSQCSAWSVGEEEEVHAELSLEDESPNQERDREMVQVHQLVAMDTPPKRNFC